MDLINYAIALLIVLAAFSASAWDSLTPLEALERCHAGNTDACTVARAYQQNQEVYSSPYHPNYAPRRWGPAGKQRRPIWLKSVSPIAASPGTDDN
jgi:hypothetical protein